MEQDPDPLFHETDPRIRIHIKMKRIRNTGNYILQVNLLTNNNNKTNNDMTFTSQYNDDKQNNTRLNMKVGWVKK